MPNCCHNRVKTLCPFCDYIICAGTALKWNKVKLLWEQAIGFKDRLPVEYFDVRDGTNVY